MKVSDKVKLVELLRLYQSEKAQQNIENIKDKWGCRIPTKALFTHARVLASKISVEIEKELKSTWDV